MLAFTAAGKLRKQVDLNHVFGVWEEAEHLEATHTGTGNASKLHTERSQLASRFNLNPLAVR